MKLRLTMAAASAFLFSSFAQADIIKCVFTEPFISVNYSTTTNEMSISSFDGEKEVVETIKNVSFQIKGDAKFELLSKDNKILMKLELNNQGSDGMSDNNYPYSAQYMIWSDSETALWGGCSSNFLKVKRAE